MSQENVNEYLIRVLDWIKVAMLTNRKLLQVIANGGKLHEIGGFAYGRTSVGDPYILLYPSHPNMIQKVCRVYPQDFDKLPYHVPHSNIPKNNITDGNPDKTKAKKAGNYRNCARFTVATVEGKQSANKKMGPEIRFYDVIELTRNQDDELRQTVPEISEISGREETEVFPPGMQETEIFPSDKTDKSVDKTDKSDESLDKVIAREGVNAVLFGTNPEPTRQRLHDGDGEIHTTVAYLYADGTEPPDNPQTIEIFNAYKDAFNKAPKDSLALKSWHQATAKQPATA